MKEKEVVVEKEWQQFQNSSSNRSNSMISTVDTTSVSIDTLSVNKILCTDTLSENKAYH